MKILIIGNGGREHAFAWKVAQSAQVKKVFVAPGNAGTALENKCENIAIAVDDIEALAQFAQQNKVYLTIVGPEVPLVLGIVDYFKARNLRCFGPSKAAAQLEGSKRFAKDFFLRHNIPTAQYQVFDQVSEAVEYLKTQPMPIVIKADGLAAGKGVIIADDFEQAKATVIDMLEANKFGSAGAQVVIEQFLKGEEASFIVISDGKNALAMASSQDHKARDNNDLGPNTGGMGAYSPAPIIDQQLHNIVMQTIIQPIIDGMAAEGHEFVGFLYAGLMIDKSKKTQESINVLEINVRFGDPETQPILMRLESNLVKLCDAALDKNLSNITALWKDQVALAVVMAANGYPDKYPTGELIKHIPQESNNFKVFHAGTKLEGKNITSSGGRVLTVCALGADVVSAQQNAYLMLAKIDWPNAYYRTDIGFKAI